MASKPKRAALYLRVSTDGQKVDNQRLTLEAVCEQRGWEVVEVYADCRVPSTPMHLFSGVDSLQWIAGKRVAEVMTTAPFAAVLVLTQRIRWFDMGERTNAGQHHHAWGGNQPRTSAGISTSAAARLDGRASGLEPGKDSILTVWCDGANDRVSSGRGFECRIGIRTSRS